MTAGSRVTSLDVARLARVSQSTVSRALRSDKRVSAATRRRIEEAATALGYTPNAIARSLITRQTNIIGIVTADITIPFQSYVLEKFIQKLHAVRKQVLVFTADPDQSVDDLLPSALQYQVDGLIVTSATLFSRSLYECHRRGAPLVLFNRYMDGGLISAVSCDNLAAGRLVADFLLDTGHQRLAYMAGDPCSSTNRDRQQGFVTRLWERGAPKPVILENDRYTYDAGFSTALRLLAHGDLPDAIFCASDGLALGTIDAARELAIAIPDRLSVVGFDDVPMARWNAYRLTTVRFPVDEMIDAAIQAVLEPTAAPELKRFPCMLVERSSTRPRTSRTEKIVTMTEQRADCPPGSRSHSSPRKETNGRDHLAH